MPTFVHPNGTVYGVAIEKQGGLRQNLTIYRKRPGASVAERVHSYIGGGVDAQTQIAAGGCVILRDGSLETWASADPVGGAPISKSGFVGGFWPPIPHVDDPWSSGGGTLFDAVRTAPAWEGRMLHGGELVDVPNVFGVPAAARYDIRFVALADAPDIRVRAGTQSCPFFVTVNTQQAGRQVMTNGPTPGPHIWVSAVDGAGQSAQAQVWLQIVGYA